MALNNIKTELIIPSAASASVTSLVESIAGTEGHASKIPAMLPTTPLPLNAVVTSNVMYMYSCSQCDFKTPVEAVFKNHVDTIHLGLPATNVILGQTTAGTAVAVANVNPATGVISTQPQTIVMPAGQVLASAAAAAAVNSAVAASSGSPTPTGPIGGPISPIDKMHKCPKCNLLLPSKNQLTQHKRKVHGKAALAAATGGAVTSSAVTYAVVTSQPAGGILATTLPASALGSVSALTAGPGASALLSGTSAAVTTGTNLTGKKTYSCTACGYSTTRRDGLSQHYDSVHLKIKNHQCELCPYAASQKGTLNRHVKLRHKKREVLS